jgi:hypothetical protein
MIKIFSRKLSIFVGLTFITALFGASVSLAQVSEVETVVYSYLNSLASGDVAAIEGLIDGPLAERTKGVFRNPDQYGNFLRQQYDQASMSVVSITPAANSYHAKIQIDYISGKTSSYVLVVSDVNGVWKITDEIQAGSP